jgi:guanylate kinase
MIQRTLFIVTAPSGAGKTTLVKEVLQRITDLSVSVSYTTRPIRPGEIEGENYHFVDEKKFLNMYSNNDFLEVAEVYGHKYGTSRLFVTRAFEQGNDVILEIDWQGAEQIKRLFQKACSIFILPPSLRALTDRLYKRQQDDSETIEVRMAEAKEVISHFTDADYVVVNDKFDETVEDIVTIIRSQRLRVQTQRENLANLMSDLTRED